MRDQAAQQARTNALTLVEQVAELADAQALSFEEVAANLGINLADLADKLGVDQDTLTQMLDRQAEEAAEQREAVLEIPDRFDTAVAPIVTELQALKVELEVQRILLQSIDVNTNRTAGAAESQAETVANQDLVGTSGAPRSSRIGSGGSGLRSNVAIP